MKVLSITLVLASIVALTMAAPHHPQRIPAILDSLIDLFGLRPIWTTIHSLASDIQSQFDSTIEAVFFAGSQAWAEAKPVLQQLVKDVLAHLSNATPYVTAAIAQLHQIVVNALNGRMQRNWILETLGLNEVWNDLTASAIAQFTSLMGNLIFAGTEVWNQAKEIISTMVAEMTSHLGNTSEYVQTAINALTALIANAGSNRDARVFDFLANLFGLSGIWQTINDLASNVKDQFFAVLNTLLFAGTQAWTDAKPIFSELVSNVLSHLTNATPFVETAIAQLQQVVANALSNGKRNVENQRFLQSLAELFGMGSIASTINSLASNVQGQLTSVLTSLLTSGTQAWTEAKPILQTMVSQVLSHLSNATPFVVTAIQQLQQIVSNVITGKRQSFVSTIVSMFGLDTVWDTITHLSSSVLTQFKDMLFKLFMAGSTAWSQAKPIISQMISDIGAHTLNATPFVESAMAQLAQVISNVASGKRADEDQSWLSSIASIFGLDTIWATITHLAGNIKEQFFAVLTSLFFAGTQAWAEAKPIFTQMVADVLAHLTNAGPYVETAIAQLQQVIANAVSGKRSIIEARGFLDWISSNFNLSGILSTITGLHSSLSQQFFELLDKVMFAGQTIINEAKPILSQLVSNLAGHTENIIPLLTAAVAQLSSLFQN